MARGSPKEKASIFKMHTVKKGLDKNLYIVSKKTNGVKYWKTNKEEKIVEMSLIKMFLNH